MPSDFQQFVFEFNPISLGLTNPKEADPEQPLWLKSTKPCAERIEAITPEEIDGLAEHPKARSVVITGLKQDTFDYFVKTYGPQLKEICFWKNKMVEDWSLLGELPGLEYVFWFHNQRITRLWNMEGNNALKGICLKDFSRLKQLGGIEKAKKLTWLYIGNAVWPRWELESLEPLDNPALTHLWFGGKRIMEKSFDFLNRLPHLEELAIAGRLYKGEEIEALKRKTK